MGSSEFVGATNEEVALHLRHVDEAVRGVVHGVDVQQRGATAFAAHHFRHAPDGRQRATGVGSGAHGHHARARVDARLELAEIEETLGNVEGNPTNFHALEGRSKGGGNQEGASC